MVPTHSTLSSIINIRNLPITSPSSNPSRLNSQANTRLISIRHSLVSNLRSLPASPVSNLLHFLSSLASSLPRFTISLVNSLLLSHSSLASSLVNSLVSNLFSSLLRFHHNQGSRLSAFRARRPRPNRPNTHLLRNPRTRLKRLAPRKPSRMSQALVLRSLPHRNRQLR